MHVNDILKTLQEIDSSISLIEDTECLLVDASKYHSKPIAIEKLSTNLNRVKTLWVNHDSLFELY